jgi:hypothetical protein
MTEKHIPVTELVEVSDMSLSWVNTVTNGSYD